MKNMSVCARSVTVSTCVPLWKNMCQCTKLALLNKKIFKSEVEYYGHIIDKNGLNNSDRKVEPVQRTTKPTTQTQILSLCGPLYSCTNTTNFERNAKCDKAFKEAKRMLLSHEIFCHYEPSLPLVLACDAAESGMGAYP
ncbi:uncharacterized protein LOC124775503 [Schistocerca piceifrons]|uniref:uncharacterized protein LOC124775503 n=1 Tax=Schistocerca piceifrons TaxID=274613 RepID=UPI001F5E947F|nr:uncharacterized protein LOC124775503 [Schistocerca piceifrons]